MRYVERLSGILTINKDEEFLLTEKRSVKEHERHMISLRRHHKRRLRKKLATRLRQENIDTDRQGHEDDISIRLRSVDNAQVCSCLMCGNPRRHIGHVTLQERKAIEASEKPEF